MGQKDPLVEWQREGFDMFGQMMHGIWQDFIRYVMHVQVQVRQPQAVAAGGAAGEVEAGTKDALPDVSNWSYSAPDDPSTSGGSASMAAAARAGGGSDGNGDAQQAQAGGNGSGAADKAATNTPVVKSEWDKTPRNAPCPCGSGKKFKMCHGRA
jgi:preprotein translocase subunit SecA